MLAGYLWAVFTVVAAAAQTIRNATQRELTRTLGTVGATHVRFLFGFPFAVSVPRRRHAGARARPAVAAARLLAVGRRSARRPRSRRPR